MSRFEHMSTGSTQSNMKSLWSYCNKEEESGKNTCMNMCCREQSVLCTQIGAGEVRKV